MASQPTVTTSDMETGLTAARNALAAALSGKPAENPSAPAATPAVEPTAPAPAAPAAPTPPPEATPASAAPFSTLPAGLLPTTPSPAPSPSAPPAAEVKPVPPTFTDPAAARFLEMKGGDVQRALSDALRYNNRLAELQKTHPELFIPGAPGDPNLTVDPATAAPFAEPVPPPPGATPPPVGEVPPLNWQEIATEADKRVLVDCKPIIEEWSNNKRFIDEGQNRLDTEMAPRIQYLDRLLKDERVAASLPELEREELAEERRTLFLEASVLRSEISTRKLDNRSLDDQFKRYRAGVMDEISTTYVTKAREEKFNSDLQKAEQEETVRLSTAWPGAVSRVAAANLIPQDFVGDFDAYARQVAQASLNNPSFVITDVDQFLVGVAKTYLERLDRYHRAQAARYGQAAAARAASPAPVGPAGLPSPATAPSNPTPEEAMEEAGRHLRERLGR